MVLPTPGSTLARTASLIVINPSGNRNRVSLDRLPFNIGRHPDNQLVLRDNRASRNHARICSESGDFFVEDLKSSHGVFVNGDRVAERQRLQHSDRIEFGFPDSYSLVFTVEEAEIQKILDQLSPPTSASQTTGNLSKLRALVEVARALHNSLSTDDVMAAVVDAALAITGFERGFLLVNRNGALEITVARDRLGATLAHTDLEVPTSQIERALLERRELLCMNFDPRGLAFSPDATIDGIEFRNVLCVPLVRIRAASTEETCLITSATDTIGLVFLDSRRTEADLSSGNRELLQTLALEASTVLENARLLEEERIKQRMEEELDIARDIQTSLLPRSLPVDGWLRVAASSIASHEVGGDCFDVRQVSPSAWSAIVSDVSGKGVSSALLAALLQGAFLLSPVNAVDMEQMMTRLNHFLNERTEGEKYATVFYCVLQQNGLLRWVNAGHCAPFLVGENGKVRKLPTTGMPLGLLEPATYRVEELVLQRGDKILIYSDGLSEAQNLEGMFFESSRLEAIVRAHASMSAAALHGALMSAVDQYTEGAAQNDDMTAVVLEYQPFH